MSKKKIVLIDDEEMILESLGSLFEMEHDVVTFEKPLDALEYLKNPENKPDCIVCDVNMPKMNGIELLKAYRKDETIPHAKFVFFTGHGDYIEELESLKIEYKVDEICIKPDFEIIDKVDKIINKD